MAFNVTEFTGAIKNGGARPNLFEATILSPSGDMSDFRYMCKAAQVPGSTIPAIDVPYFGRQIRVAGNRTFEPWTVTIMNDENFTIRNGLEGWMEKINSHVGNNTVLPLESYKTTGDVIHFGKNGGKIARYQFEGLFPTEIGAIELSWENNDQIEEYTVTFAYDYWTHTSETKGLVPA